MANSSVVYAQYSWDKMSRKEQLEAMDIYYDNNSLYEATRLLKYYLGVWNEDIRPLRTPVHRSVEFYTSKIAVGEPSIFSKNNNQALLDAVARVLDWSNFQSVKSLQVRDMSKYGDVFRRIVSEGDKVWHEMVETEYVTGFVEDTRGFITEIRLDIPIESDNGLQKTRTEFYTVNDNLPYMAVWEHIFSDNTPLNELGEPIMYAPLAQFGIDFVPFVRSSFQKTRSGWGMNCVQHALLKVDEANRQATKLHQMLFRYNKPTWLVRANQTMPDGTPVAPPKLKQGTNNDKTDLELRDNSILYLPGMVEVDALVPNINYKDALEILMSQEKELEKDLPELLYYSVPERADMSGKALRTLLGAAVDRRNQAENNYVEGTVRLNQMAITVGQYKGIFGSDAGSFDTGTTNHSIRYADPFPSDISEKAATLQTLVGSGIPLSVAMSLSGFSAEEISQTSNTVSTQ